MALIITRQGKIYAKALRNYTKKDWQQVHDFFVDIRKNPERTFGICSNLSRQIQLIYGWDSDFALRAGFASAALMKMLIGRFLKTRKMEPSPNTMHFPCNGGDAANFRAELEAHALWKNPIRLDLLSFCISETAKRAAP